MHIYIWMYIFFNQLNVEQIDEDNIMVTKCSRERVDGVFWYKKKHWTKTLKKTFKTLKYVLNNKFTCMMSAVSMEYI